MRIYYNDNDRKVCEWMSYLMSSGLIAEGVIDDQEIQTVSASDVREAHRAHFFAGISGWEYALQLAGWPEDLPVWTGSCPCQPYSIAGKGGGDDDPRNLWPRFRQLIDKCRPPTIFGEQVASPAGREWFSGIRVDLEELGYVVGAADLCAACVGAPNIRQRLFWVADSQITKRGSIASSNDPRGRFEKVRRSGSFSGLGVPDGEGRVARQLAPETSRHGGTIESASRVSFWDDFEFIPCGDGKTRRIKPGLECLVTGLPGRVAQLRGLGNAINPEIAAQFIGAFMEVRGIQ